MNATLLETVRDVEPFHSVFMNTLPDMVAKTSKAARWRARRGWMTFMAENAVEFGQRWPELVWDLMGMMMEILEKDKGGETYLENARTVLWMVRAFLPAEEGAGEEDAN